MLKAKPFCPQRISRRGLPVRLGMVVELARAKVVKLLAAAATVLMLGTTSYPQDVVQDVAKDTEKSG